MMGMAENRVEKNMETDLNWVDVRVKRTGD